MSWGRVIRRHTARHGVVKQAEKSQIGLINRVLERQAEVNVKYPENQVLCHTIAFSRAVTTRLVSTDNLHI